MRRNSVGSAKMPQDPCAACRWKDRRQADVAQ